MTDPLAQAPTILYVDDEPNALKYFERAIGPLAPVATAGSVEEGKRVLDQHAGSIAVLVCDQRMPGAYGNELLFYAWDRHPHIVRILTTAYAEIEHTVDAVNQGQIYRYIQKPWEIGALRVEIMQAIELARLRKDHAALLSEKLLIRQKQTVANRIGSLYALCATLAKPGQLMPVEAYLSAALCARLSPPEPDWLLLDYADLIAAEAFRSASFAGAVCSQLEQIESEQARQDVESALKHMAEQIGAEEAAGGSIVFRNARMLTEFLETPANLAVSARHANWLACLLWLGKRGWLLQSSRGELGVQCRLARSEAVLTPAQLAAWVEQF
ncbi:MAG: response regulator [Pseudomonadota bacterium]